MRISTAAEVDQSRGSITTPGTGGPDCFSLTACGEAMPGGRLLESKAAWPVPLDPSTRKYVADRFRVSLPAAGRCDPTRVQSLCDLVSDVAPARRIARMIGSTLTA